MERPAGLGQTARARDGRRRTGLSGVSGRSRTDSERRDAGGAGQTASSVTGGAGQTVERRDEQRGKRGERAEQHDPVNRAGKRTLGNVGIRILGLSFFLGRPHHHDDEPGARRRRQNDEDRGRTARGVAGPILTWVQAGPRARDLRQAAPPG